MCLLNTLDSFHTSNRVDRVRIRAAVQSARKERASIDAFSEKAARSAALKWYLVGLPLGAVAGAILVSATWHSLTIGAFADKDVLAACLASGAIGAVISVMARITRGKRLDVDYEHAGPVTLLAGSFQPIIGAVFGGAVYVLVLGGLLPLDAPTGSGQTGLYFAGLAFLAGFSERWAQDTIVSSAPKVTARADRPADGLPVADSLK